MPRFCAKCASTSLMCAWRLYKPACQYHQLQWDAEAIYLWMLDVCKAQHACVSG